MPLLTTRIPNLQASGPLIEVLITPSQALRAMLESQKLPVPSALQRTMLIDTGASASAIKTGIAQELKLQPHGTITVSTASHKDIIFPTYDIDLIFRIQKVGVMNVRVFESNFEGQSIDGLIGRDILSRGLMIYHGYDNSFTIGF